MDLTERFCAICGPEAPKELLYPANFSPEDFNPRVFSARRAPDRIHCRLMKCSDCGLVFSDPVPPREMIDTLYRKSGILYAEEEAEIFHSYAAVLDRALARLEHRSRFVEIGGGSGFMLEYGHRSGFSEQVEIEMSEDARRRFKPPGPSARFVSDRLGPGALEAGSASLACFFQVIDHVADPMEFLANVRSILAPGGLAVCVCHNTSALTAKVFGERSPIFDIQHQYLFNRENLRKAFLNAGFEVLEDFPVSNRYSLRYWIMMAPLAARIRTLLGIAAGVFGLAGKKLNLRAGNIGLIARKPPGDGLGREVG